MVITFAAVEGSPFGNSMNSRSDFRAAIARLAMAALLVTSVRSASAFMYQYASPSGRVKEKVVCLIACGFGWRPRTMQSYGKKS